MPTRAPIHEQHARYVLIGGFAKRRRVLELGCLDASAAHVLFDAGATSVTVGTNDPNLAQGEVQTLDDTNLPLPIDTRGFDLVLCHDLPERLARDPGWTHELRRILAPGGILVAAVKNAASDLDYRGLYDLLAPHFGEAAFYGQSSVRGALFYDLEIEELEPEIDRTLLGEEDEEPTWYLAVFAPEALHGGKLTFAQLDATHAEANADVEAEAGFSADAEADTDADAEADAYVDADVDADPLEDAAQAEAEEELRTLELQYQEAQARLADHDQAMDEVMVRLETSELERRQLEETLRVTKSEVQDLENELGATGARALHAEHALAQLQDARRHAAEHDQAAQDAQQALHGRIAELERTMSERETHRHEERALLDAEIGELVAERDRLAAALRSADDRAKNLANDFEAFRNSAYGRERELAKLIEQLEAHHARARESDTQ